MSWTASSRTSASALAARFAALIAWLLAVSMAGGCAARPAGTLIHRDDFSAGLDQWHIEAEQPARVEVRDGALEIDTPAGITLWFRHRLEGPVRIEFDATAVAAGGANDQVSDLNVFWMASNRDGLEPVFARARTGKFAEYDDLLTYYVGLGGNRNSTTRFRRYIGEPGNRPLYPEHDLGAPETLLVPNKKQTIVLTADRHRIRYERDGRVLFELEDPQSYTHGWFALRSTWSHLRIDDLRVYSLKR